MRCKNCKHYKPEQMDVWRGIGKETDYYDGYGTCDNEYCQWDCKMPKNLMTVTCFYDGGVIIGEDFGCIHFERNGNDPATV